MGVRARSEQFITDLDESQGKHLKIILSTLSGTFPVS